MPAKFYGQERNEIVNRLVDKWLRDGPPVAILAGFPGCGKTQIAREVIKQADKNFKSLEIKEPTPDVADPVHDLFLDLAFDLDNKGLPRLLQELDKGVQANFSRVLLNELRHQPVLVVVDEFQRLFPSEATTPPQPWSALVEQLNNSSDVKGRLLLISNRSVRPARWCENCLIPKEIKGLPDSEAEVFFSELLDSSGYAEAVPLERRQEIARRLGGNPRALKTLVGSLRTDSLDELLSAAPDLMKTGDVVLDPRLIEDFERELIERALPKLENDLLKFMRWLSVHRRPFKKEALAQFTGGREKPETLRHRLNERFLLDHNGGWNAPHPLAREISVSRLRANAKEWKQAHSLAADYHLRHFKARQLTGGATLAASYSELRHHLYEAGRIEELSSVSNRLITYTLSQINVVTPVPKDKELLEERITLLTALPGGRRPPVLEYHLARCFQRRGAPGDNERALRYARKATGPSAIDAVWLVRLDLENELHGIDTALPVLQEALRFADVNAFALYQRGAELLDRAERVEKAIELLQQGIKVIPADKSLSSLYQSCAELLDRAGRIDDAIVLLQQGIKVIPADKNLFALYQSCAELLDRAGRIEEAIVLLQQGIKVIPADKSLSSLYQSCAELLDRAGRIDDAIELLQQGIKVIPADKSLSSLYQSCAELLDRAGRIDDAIVLLQQGIKVIPADKNLFALYQSCAELLDRAGRIEEAIVLLQQGIKVIPADKSLSSLYQSCAELLDRAGRIDDAIELLQQGIKVIPADKSLSSLYQSCAELLDRAGRIDDAIVLLQQGIKVIPADKNLFALYQSCAELLDRAGRIEEAIVLLQQGIKVIPADKSLSSLYQFLSEIYCRGRKPAEAIVCQREGFRRIGARFNGYKLAEGALLLCVATGDVQQLNEMLAATGADALSPQHKNLGEVLKLQEQGEWAKAAALAKNARADFPHYFTLAAQEAFSHLANDDAESALHVLDAFSNLTFLQGSPHAWLATFVYLRCAQRDEAALTLVAYLGRPLDKSRELNEAFLLRLWDERENEAGNHRLCFHLPLLPPVLTGLSSTVRRVQFSPPVLPEENGPIPAAPIEQSAVRENLQPTKPDTYVSYAWGEDKTEVGREREEIVNQLCQAICNSGRTVGRDKARLKAGDSIERFANEIAKAQRIVAVISEKSLHSKYCMVYELFQAYRRSGYYREEFQEKVIALVMDDATTLLQDDLAIARFWKEKCDTERSLLLEIDPNRLSSEKWKYVNLMSDMSQYLPDMLGALQDIVMKRGFTEIVDDEFREVLQRLPKP